MKITTLAAAGLLLALGACSPPPVPPAPGPVPEEDGSGVAAPSVAAPAPRWTIRIHSDEDPTRAEEVASLARDRFDEPVEVVLGGGTAHVDVTGFRSRDDARAFLAIARERGYRSASLIEPEGT